MRGLAGVEEQGGAGGEFAVDEDEVGLLVWGTRARGLLGDDGVGKAFGAHGGIEADQAFVHREQEADSGSGEGEVGGVGAGWSITAG